jgi:hypothetical protein
MATAYTPILQLALPVTGELNGTWGTVVNDNITSMIEQAIAGLATINTWTTASHTLTTANGTTSEARCAVLECSGAPGAAASVICPASTKLYVIKNSVTGGFAVTLKTSAGTGISVPNGSTALLYCDGTNVVSGATYMATVSTTQVDILAQGDLRLQDTTGGEYVALQAPATIATSYTLTLPADDGTAGQALVTDGSGVLSWSTAASGDVYGPASATDNAIARYDGTTGKIIQNSAVTIADDGATVIAANSASDGLRITQIGAGNALVVEDSANPDATPVVIDASGNVIVGASTSYTTSGSAPIFQMHSASGSFAQIGATSWASGTDTGASVSFCRSDSGAIGTHTLVGASDVLGNLSFSGSDGTNFIQAAKISAVMDGTPGTNDMPGRLVFSTTADGASSPTERMRIDSAGRVGIGSTSLAGYRVRVGGVFETTSTTGLAVAADTTIPSNVTGNAYGFYSAINTAASAFTLAILHHYRAVGQTPGAGSTVTSQYGFHADSGLTGATNNYGFYGNIASGTSRFNFYAAGTATNYFEGSTYIGAVLGNDTKFAIGGTLPSAGAASYGARVVATMPSTTTGGAIGFDTTLSTQAAAFTLSTLYHYSASQGTIGAGSTVTNQYGYIAQATLIGATNNYGFYGNIASGTGRYNFYAAGTAANYFAGNTGVGILPSTYNFDVYNNSQAVDYLLSRFVTEAAPTGQSQTWLKVEKGSNYGGAIGGYLNQGVGSGLLFGTQNASATPTTRGQVSSAGVWSLGATAGSESLRVTPVASAVNFFNVTGSATSVAVGLSAIGTDTNIPIQITAKGTGNTVFYGNSAPQFNITSTASAVNYLQVTGGATTAGVNFSAQGSDTNIFITYDTKGTEAHSFRTNAGAQQQFRIAHTASAVNYLQVTGSATGNRFNLSAQGSDTNVGMNFAVKGTENFVFATSAGTAAQFLIAHTASAVNYLQVTGAATGGLPTLSAQGSDTNISLFFQSKGAFGIGFGSSGGGQQFAMGSTASAVNYLQVTGGATGNAATMSAAGSDTNIDLALTPKGTGNVRFGTLTANADAPITGYITIKDAGGTTRKLAIIA